MNDLPCLPGYRFTDITQTNFLVPRSLSYKNGHRIITTPSHQSHVYLTDKERYLLNNFQPELIYGKVRIDKSRTFVPRSVLFDKKILRFYGYFKEIVYESPLESYRIRRVIIYYYLENDTMSIYEIPYANSALNQGTRVYRHRICKTNQNEAYNWRDLNLGEKLNIYGTIYYICDCDQFTRNWLESEGIIVQSAQNIPCDPYMLKKNIVI